MELLVKTTRMTEQLCLRFAVAQITALIELYLCKEARANERNFSCHGCVAHATWQVRGITQCNLIDRFP